MTNERPRGALGMGALYPPERSRQVVLRTGGLIEVARLRPGDEVRAWLGIARKRGFGRSSSCASRGRWRPGIRTGPCGSSRIRRRAWRNPASRPARSSSSAECAGSENGAGPPYKGVYKRPVLRHIKRCVPEGPG